MKIKLKSTKLVDENKNPITFFHTTPCGKIKHFFPLSHFGTREAAQMRSMHFIYDALGMAEPVSHPDKIPPRLLEKLLQQKSIPNLQTYSVHLAIKSPLRMPDIIHHSLEHYYRWFSHQYAPKSQYLEGRERCEGDVVGPARIKYKDVVSDFIFLDPFTRSEAELKKELLAESFYTIPEKLETPKYIPSFLSSVRLKMDKRLYFLAENVAFQRMMRYLEGEGYDGISYQNAHEDVGQKSYIIFRPEQVFHLYEEEKEHIIPEKTPSQKAFLQDVEIKFFEAHGITSPSQRIAKHLQQRLKSRSSILK